MELAAQTSKFLDVPLYTLYGGVVSPVIVSCVVDAPLVGDFRHKS